MAVLSLSACSAGDATSHAATLDGPAAQACRELRTVIQDRAARAIGASELRSRLLNVYNDAQSSTNPIIRTRAVTLLTDATEMAEGDEGQSLPADLQAMQQTCSEAPV
jgi:hypothetical protein